MKNKLLEICCYSVQSAIIAQKAGADRIELCASMPEGGVTPSFGTIQLCKELLGIKLHVIMRPRGGDFLYSDMEFETMKRDVLFCKDLNVDGVVIGLLKKDGSIDLERTFQLIELARPMSVTFHRAFDMSRNPLESIHQLIELGVDRVLTSGQEQTAVLGQKLIRKLIEETQKRIIILPGAGLNESIIEEFALYTGANEFHMSAKAIIEGGMEFRNSKINMGGIAGISEYDKYEADSNAIKKVVNILKTLS